MNHRLDRFFNRSPYRQQGIQGFARFLKDELYFSAKAARTDVPAMPHLAPFESDRPAGRLNQAQDAPPDRRLSGARLSADRNRLSPSARNATLLDRLHYP